MFGIALENIRTGFYGSGESGEDAQDCAIPAAWLWTAIGISILTIAALLLETGLHIALNGASAGFCVAIAGLALVGFHGRGTNRPVAIRHYAQDVLAFMTMGLTGAVGSYAVAAFTHGWTDHAMVRLDAAMGFDWRDVYALTAAHPALQTAGRIAYASIYASPAILLLAFARAGQRMEARFFLASFWLAAVLTMIFFLFLPTLGPLAYMWREPVSYMPMSALYQAEIIPLLRDHQMQVVDLGSLRGLVGAPSFHAACATLYLLAARNAGAVRTPVTLLNVAMLFSIPVEGTHYATDIVAGMAVALAAHGMMTLLVRMRRSGGLIAIDPTPYAVATGTPAA
jgi:hypothetical protein